MNNTINKKTKLTTTPKHHITTKTRGENVKNQKEKAPKGAPNTFWFRVQMYQYKTANKETHEQEARQLLQDVYRYSFVKDVQMVSDVGLINLIGAGIQEAFTDAAADAEGSAEA